MVSELPKLPTAIDTVEAIETEKTPVASVADGGPKAAYIAVPIYNWDVGFVRRNIDLNLNRAQATRLKQIQLGLEQAEAKLANGKSVSNGIDAIRWMLENFSDVEKILPHVTVDAEGQVRGIRIEGSGLPSLPATAGPA